MFEEKASMLTSSLNNPLFAVDLDVFFISFYFIKRDEKNVKRSTVNVFSLKLISFPDTTASEVELFSNKC